MALRIGLVAGEASGDLLGAGLIDALRERYPDAEFAGIGGPHMLERGFHSLYPMDRLSVMGLVEPLKRLPELLRMRAGLRRHFLHQGFDLVVGIDSPDFNLGLERWLKRRGITTAHYVSPSVWAWRQGRIRTVAAAVDLMLTLFPFEERFYREHGVAVACVGHPLADRFPLQPDQAAARQTLGLASDRPVVALMPGSRGGELAQLAEPFLQAARWLHQRQNDVRFLLPAANAERYTQLSELLAAFPELPLTLLEPGRSQLAMTAADAVLMASGTTTLEAMLLKRPMVVAYRMAPWSYRILSRMVKTPFIALPNLLAQRPLVPELLQDAVQPETMGALLLERLRDPRLQAELVDCFTDIHRDLARDASRRATAALATLLPAAARPGDADGEAG